MKRRTVFVVDENPRELRASCSSLADLLGPAGFEVVGVAPKATLGEFASLLAHPTVSAFVLDQRLWTSGHVTYGGLDLAEFLRGVDSKIPIYILTNYPDEEVASASGRYRVEDILDKHDLEDIRSEAAVAIQARFVRRSAAFQDVLNDRERRYHELLLKSMKEALTPEEDAEMGGLEGERSAAVVAAEREHLRKMNAEIESLERALDRVKKKGA